MRFIITFAYYTTIIIIFIAFVSIWQISTVSLQRADIIKFTITQNFNLSSNSSIDKSTTAVDASIIDNVYYSKNDTIQHLLSSPKLILIWTPFFYIDLRELITKWLASHTCHHQCIYTNDRSRLSDADALIFHPRDPMNQLPSIRHSHQYYIFFLHESPHHTGDLSRLPAEFFNLTMTYRRDSDIVMYYDALFPIKSNDSNLDQHIIYTWQQVTDTVANKTKMALQFVSNCATNSMRESYVQQLIAAGLELDQFGACSGGSKSISCPYATQCEDQFASKYRFYIAFENSICRDYVTEKFWRMKKLIVPLVLRAKDYQHIAPIGSYIAVDQFKSITQLVTYLKMLSTNTTEYLKYFEWTKTYRGPDRSRPFGFSTWSGYCELCQLLHNRSRPVKTYENMQQWWIDDAQCEMGFARKLADRQMIA